MKTRFFKTSDGAWVPDANKIVLFCSDEEVGTCDFDMASFINAFGDYRKVHARIVPLDYIQSDPNETVLRGDINRFPGAAL